MSKFYTYRQNNSGGSFDEDENLSQYVIIEAKNPDEASTKAQDVGIYFDGVREGQDCGCCGDRWYDDPDAYEFPSLYGKPLENEEIEWIKWMENDVTIHYLDGRVEKYCIPKKGEKTNGPH